MLDPPEPINTIQDDQEVWVQEGYLLYVDGRRRELFKETYHFVYAHGECKDTSIRENAREQ